MQTKTVIIWSLTLLLALGLSLPAVSQGITIDLHLPHHEHQHDRDNIRVVKMDDGEHARVFQLWCSAQLHTYNEIDAESHERVGDLLQLVNAVEGNRLWLVDQKAVRRQVVLSGHTEVTFPRFHRVEALTDGALADTVTPGDLVTVQGYLLGDGGMKVNKIHVLGRAWGWDPEAGAGNYGVRYWGNVLALDAASGWCEVKTDVGRRRVHLLPEGEVLFDGRSAAFETLHVGDRVVFYADLDDRRNMDIYRLVILHPEEGFPEADHHFHFDPEHHVYHGAPGMGGDSQVVDGHVDSLATGDCFHKLILRTDDGRSHTVFVASTLRAEHGGAHLALTDLKASDHLHIAFRDVNGTFFATRIDVR